MCEAMQLSASRTCTVCGATKPLTAFRLRGKRDARARRSLCLDCDRVRTRAQVHRWVAANHERVLLQRWQRRRRDRYIPNRVLMRAIAAARVAVRERETCVGSYALVRAVFAVPADADDDADADVDREEAER